MTPRSLPQPLVLPLSTLGGAVAGFLFGALIASQGHPGPLAARALEALAPISAEYMIPYGSDTVAAVTEARADR